MAAFERKSLREVLGERGYIRGPFGSALLRRELQTEGIPVYEQQHAITGTREFRFFVSEEKLKELSRFQVKPNDLIISCSGTIGRISVIQPDDPMGIISQALLILRPHSRDVLPEFLHYFLLTSEGRHSLVQASHGSVQVNIAPRAVVENIELPVPQLPEQRAIVHILGTLDDKIDLNRRVNETLEAMARALFKSWFVDFDPVRAKAEGRDPGLPKPLADLFPDSFEDSEVGEIPRGWEVATLDALAQIQGGKQLPTEDCKSLGVFPVFGANGIMGYADRATHDGFVIAFGRVGAYCGSVHWTYGGAWINNNASSVVPKQSPEFVLQAMLMADFEVLRTGSAQPFIPNSSLASIQVLRPDANVLDAFCSRAGRLRRREQELLAESRTLAALRDALLPKLISGELQTGTPSGQAARRLE